MTPLKTQAVSVEGEARAYAEATHEYIADMTDGKPEMKDIRTAHEAGYIAGHRAAEGKYAKLVEAATNAVTYYEDSLDCIKTCDPSVGFHEPECSLAHALREALVSLKGAP
jgi:hypothetical protein